VRKLLVIAVIIAAVLATGWWRYRVTRPGHRFERGLAAVRDRDWRTAECLAARLGDSGHADLAHVLLAESAYARKDPEAALRECNLVAADGGPAHLRSALLSGKCLLDLGEPAEAQRAFAFVVREQADNADAHRGLAAAAYDLGQMGEALAHIDEVIRLDPSDYRPYRLKGNIFRDLGDQDQAGSAYGEALRRNAPTAVRQDIQLDLAEVLVQQAQFARALEVLAADDDGGEPSPRSAALKAEALRGVGRGPEAIAVVDRALDAYPDGVFYRLRGQLYLDQGNAADAIPMLEQAARLYKRPYQPYFLLAQAYARAGRKADADRAAARAEEVRRDLETATELTKEAMERPQDASVRIRLAEVCERLGDPELAAMWRRAAASLASRH
jgi:tetratricopeptide (TPR) repeat protein